MTSGARAGIHTRAEKLGPVADLLYLGLGAR
jgi:hypothetical protein